MAKNYTPIGSHRDIQVLGPTQVIDIERVIGATLPHGVYFERTVPLTIFGTAAADDYVNELADAIEQRLSGGLADSATFVQDVDASGLLTDLISFTVSIVGPPPVSGTFATTVDVPVNLLTGGLGGQGGGVDAMFSDAMAQLQQTAGL